MSRITNGRVIGPTVSASSTAASGIWTQEEQAVLKKAGKWPSVGSNDPYWSNVVLLMHMDGSNGGTTFTDQKGHSVSRANIKASPTCWL